MRVNVFYEKDDESFLKKKNTLNKYKYSLHLIVTTIMFVLELSKCNKLSKLNPTKGINVS